MPDDKVIGSGNDDAAVEKASADVEPKMDEIIGETKGLSEDVAEWIRLKVELIQIEVHQRITEEVNAILSSILVLSIMVIALLLGLMALGRFIGEEYLEHEGQGLAVVAVLVAVIGVLLGRTQPRWVGDVMFTLVPRRWIKKSKLKDEESRTGKTRSRG